MLTTVYRNVSSKSVFNHLTSALVWLGAVQDSVVYKQFKIFINNSNLNVGGCPTYVPTVADIINLQESTCRTRVRESNRASAMLIRCKFNIIPIRSTDIKDPGILHWNMQMNNE